MAETKRRAEMRRVMGEFERSGLTRRGFCAKRGMALTAFDYWRRELKVNAGRVPKLVRVKIAAPEVGPGFTLVLANGRRIESAWQFGEEELGRLIAVAERA
jgi:hypothetical protein